ncbi:hypothetical protein GQ607_002467 [Colletotrichum asianum]|uniref:Uncharacterized protein n=1 Tax=Colletotrichum asianum TaxID=702518 RepID=A0A8H3WSW9_9PEZI|nr:hypothetical protein GQ607_002467 [Colletotrichum asianum]
MSNASLRTGRIESAASLDCPPHYPTSALLCSAPPVQSRTDRIRIGQPRKAADAHHQFITAHPPWSPVTLSNTPRLSLTHSRVPRARIPHHSYRAKGPSLGIPGCPPTWPPQPSLSHLTWTASIAAVSSPETCLYLRRLLRAAEVLLPPTPPHHLDRAPCSLTNFDLYPRTCWPSFCQNPKHPIASSPLAVSTALRLIPSTPSLAPGSDLTDVALFVPSQPQSSCIRRTCHCKAHTYTSHLDDTSSLFRQLSNRITAISSPTYTLVTTTSPITRQS